jgi:hypothetical protein
MDRINQKYARGTVKLASEGTERAWVMRRSYKSPNYTNFIHTFTKKIFEACVAGSVYTVFILEPYQVR